MTRYINPVPQYILENGDLAAGGELSFFESGTNIPLAIFADVNLTINIANPVILGSRGEVPNIFYSQSARAVLHDADGNQLFDIDPVGNSNSLGSFNIWDSNIVYAQNDIVFGANSKAYISLVNQNEGNDPTLNAGDNAFWTEISQIKFWNAAQPFAANDLVIDDGALYKSVVADNLGNQPSTDGANNWVSIADAQFVVYDNVSSGLVSTTGQGALDEIVSLINNLPSSVVYRGQLDVSGGNASLPPTPQNGDLYVIAVAGTITVSQAGGAPTPTLVNVGEQIIYNGDTGNFDLIAQVTQASSISYNNSISGLTANDVQTAIDEVDANTDTNTSDISGLTGDLSALNGEVDTNTNLLETRGTAFGADVQTSALDATAGRLLTVGAFGLGFFDGVNYPQTSLNNAEGVETGFYRAIGTTTNKPSSVTGVVIHQVYSVSQSQFTQRFIGIDGSSFSRGSSGNTPSNPTWSAWRQAATVASLNLKADVADPNFTGQVRIPTGTAALPALRTSGDSNTGLFFPASDTVAFATGASERIRINASGNVGIGTSSPDARLNVANGSSGATPNANYDDLHVESSSNAGITISSATNSISGIAFGDVNDSFAGGIIYPNFDDSLRFLANGSERMRIDASGNVGIGTSNTGNNGAISGTEVTIDSNSTTTSGITLKGRNTTFSPSTYLYFQNQVDNVGYIAGINENSTSNGGLAFATTLSGTITERLRIRASGNVGIGTTSPSDKLDVAGSIRFSGDALMSGNAQYIRATDNGGGTPRVLGLNPTNDFFVGPIDTYAGGSIFYGSSANVINQIFDTGGTERMRINASGDVGIGTSSPGGKLDVRLTGAIGESRVARFNKFTTGDDHYLDILSNNSLNQVIFDSSGTQAGGYVFRSGTVERMRMDASGDVGIGTTSPSTILHVADALPILTLQDNNSSGASSAGYIQFTDQASARQGYVGMGSASDSELRIVSDNGGVIFDVDGTVKIGTKEVGYNQVDVAVQNANDTTFGVSNGYYYKDNTTTNSVTINSETNFPIGSVLTYANRGTQNTTIVPTSGDVMYWFNGEGAPPQGTRTLAQGGCATVVRVSNGELHITGTGIS